MTLVILEINRAGPDLCLLLLWVLIRAHQVGWRITITPPPGRRRPKRQKPRGGRTKRRLLAQRLPGGYGFPRAGGCLRLANAAATLLPPNDGSIVGRADLPEASAILPLLRPPWV